MPLTALAPLWAQGALKGAHRRMAVSAASGKPGSQTRGVCIKPLGGGRLSQTCAIWQACCSAPRSFQISPCIQQSADVSFTKVFGDRTEKRPNTYAQVCPSPHLPPSPGRFPSSRRGTKGVSEIERSYSGLTSVCRPLGGKKKILRRKTGQRSFVSSLMRNNAHYLLEMEPPF